MKIELIKEEQYKKDPWYEILIDGEFIRGSFILSLIEKQYEEILANPESLEIKREVIKSEELFNKKEENNGTIL